ncbi:MAG: helix-turn-helix transcriptional regulator [Mucilaginibacter sp.]|uniref:helix-turn-helix transcriptional regulator n=1 Tax=Mucilaginibacter sp. TaxID=1882438 RepID=UPI003263AC8C
MKVILGVEKLEKIFSKQQILELEIAIGEWKEEDSVEFRIKSTQISDIYKCISVKVIQPKTQSGSYLHEHEMVSITENIFKPYLTAGTFLVVKAYPHKSVVVNVVTPNWLEERLVKKGVRVKDLALMTGINRTNISAWVNGSRPMSQPVKAMFYFFLTQPTYKKDILQSFFDDLASANIGSTIPVVTRHLSEEDIKHHVIKRARELDCQHTLGDFAKEITHVKFTEKRFLTK